MKKILVSSIIAVLALALCGAAWAEQKPAKVIRVFDGDTVEVNGYFAAVRVRLANVDCPENKGHGWPAQPGSAKATKRVRRLTEGRTVLITPVDKDRYGRIVASIELGDGRDLGRLLVSEGLCWCYRKYNKDPELPGLEESARQARLGLWSLEKPVAPWAWRKAH